MRKVKAGEASAPWIGATMIVVGLLAVLGAWISGTLIDGNLQDKLIGNGPAVPVVSAAYDAYEREQLRPCWVLGLAGTGLALAGAAILAARATAQTRSFRRRLASKLSGYCAHCDYDLTGNTSGFCPECGAAVASQIGFFDSNSALGSGRLQRQPPE
ncbi:MAG TPA: hypothetical protein PKY77_06920 [Phycisphaerae bacterium]|nr:hypothetical protein [Phycisphaerae bacterium]HRY69597.1 hypothetical protein [Phycisphaerae bacterium]HSA27288.1 hypothetical protein [Phycisphaerae bacterium]